jgi:hypothetical protein
MISAILLEGRKSAATSRKNPIRTGKAGPSLGLQIAHEHAGGMPGDVLAPLARDTKGAFLCAVPAGILTYLVVNVKRCSTPKCGCTQTSEAQPVFVLLQYAYDAGRVRKAEDVLVRCGQGRVAARVGTEDTQCCRDRSHVGEVTQRSKRSAGWGQSFGGREQPGAVPCPFPDLP